MNAKLMVGFLFLLLLGGCAGQQSRLVSNTYDFLYPNEEARAIEPQMAILNVPLRVGVAFAPVTREHNRFDFWTAKRNTEGMSAAKKQALLEQIAGAFREKSYIDEIEIIPEAYLRPRGGFANLDQIATMHRLDVIALISYDQMQVTDEGAASLAYWTLIGAYIVSGEKNSTTTLMDTAVFDIRSRRMLFRAPGVSEIRESSTLVNLSEALRRDSNAGFEQATTQMIANLDAELDRFKQKIRERPEDYRIAERSGYSGGGAPGALLIGLLLLLMMRALRARADERY